MQASYEIRTLTHSSNWMTFFTMLWSTKVSVTPAVALLLLFFFLTSCKLCTFTWFCPFLSSVLSPSSELLSAPMGEVVSGQGRGTQGGYTQPSTRSAISHSSIFHVSEVVHCRTLPVSKRGLRKCMKRYMCVFARASVSLHVWDLLTRAESSGGQIEINDRRWQLFQY